PALRERPVRRRLGGVAMNTLKVPRKLLGMLPGCRPWACVALAAGPHPPVKKDEPEEPKRLNEVIEKSIDWYDVLPDRDAEKSLTPVPRIRWRTVPGGQEGEVMMVVWPHKGRPAVMASVYPWDGKLIYEFDSLS